jgi:hypothetical protein
LSQKGDDANSVTAIYTQYDHFDEKRAMAATLERSLTRILQSASAPATPRETAA